jgi:hypothetical protein
MFGFTFQFFYFGYLLLHNTKQSNQTLNNTKYLFTVQSFNISQSFYFALLNRKDILARP